jgi:hypothetical protein
VIGSHFFAIAAQAMRRILMSKLFVKVLGSN